MPRRARFWAAGSSPARTPAARVTRRWNWAKRPRTMSPSAFRRMSMTATTARARRFDLVEWWADIFQPPVVAFDVDDRGGCRRPRGSRRRFRLRDLAEHRATRKYCRVACAFPGCIGTQPCRRLRSTDSLELENSHRSRWVRRHRRSRRRACRDGRHPNPGAHRRRLEARCRNDFGGQSGTGHTTPAKPVTAPQVEDPAYTAFEKGEYLTALKLAEEAAGKGDKQAHTLIARIHEGGLGVDQNDVKAAEWYQKAADLGDIPAMVSLGTMRTTGRGVDKDINKAAELFEKAAAHRRSAGQLQSRPAVPERQRQA